MKLKPSKRFFYIALAAIGVALVAFYSIREAIGPFAPAVIDDNFFTAVIVALIGLFLWNRRVTSGGGKSDTPDTADKAADAGSDGIGEGSGNPDRKDGDAED